MTQVRRAWGRRDPGAAPTVRVSKGELINLLTRALRASELKTESVELQASIARLKTLQAEAERTAHAREFVAERAASAGVEFNTLEVRGLIVDAPVDADGALDEAAFLELVDQHIWGRRLAAVVERVSTVAGQDDGD
jgi:hypothetical protein